MERTLQKNAHIVWHSPRITRDDRSRRNGHPAIVVWLTGLPGSGKSTIAHGAEERLHRAGYQTYVLDGDNVRHGLCRGLGFCAEDRQENMRRVGEAARLLQDAGLVVFVALVSPFRIEREKIRQLFGRDEFVEVYCKCPLDTCESRDPKGFYRKARAGLIPDFTGIGSPYEEPATPELTLDTNLESIEQSVSRLTDFIAARAPRKA